MGLIVEWKKEGRCFGIGTLRAPSSMRSLKCIESWDRGCLNRLTGRAYEAQLLTYLRLARLHVGFLINFNVPRLKLGLRRYAL